MDKITGLPGNTDIQNKQKPAKTEPQKSDLNVSFKDSLLNAMTQPKKADGVQEIHKLGELNAPSYNTITISPDVISQKTDTLLNLIETYSSELNNPSITLKEIEPLIRQVRDSANELSNQAELLNAENNGLKKIARQSAITANVEYIKFSRGDYI